MKNETASQIGAPCVYLTLLAMTLFCLPGVSFAITVLVDPVKIAIDAFYEEGFGVDGFHPASLELEQIIEGSSQGQSRRIYALDRFADLPHEEEEFDARFYFPESPPGQRSISVVRGL